MSLLITCPHCGEPHDALQSLAEGELRELMELLAGFGPARGAASAYLDLFRAAAGAPMRVATRLRLARELRRLWDDKSFGFNRHLYHISQAQITEALHEVVRVKRGGAPFVNHNYLKQVMIGILDNAEAQGRRAAARAESYLEAKRRRGEHRQAQAPPPPEPKAEDGPPVWERPLREQALSLAHCYHEPMLAAAMPWIPRVEANLRAAGVDLERLRALATSAESIADLVGKDLVSRCQAGGSAPAPVGECLPTIEGEDA